MYNKYPTFSKAQNYIFKLQYQIPNIFQSTLIFSFNFKFISVLLRTVDLQLAFALFDRDGDGVISQQELQQVLTSLDLDVSSKQVQAMIHSVDLDGEILKRIFYSIFNTIAVNFDTFLFNFNTIFVHFNIFFILTPDFALTCTCT